MSTLKVNWRDSRFCRFMDLGVTMRLHNERRRARTERYREWTAHMGDHSWLAPTIVRGRQQANWTMSYPKVYVG